MLPIPANEIHVWHVCPQHALAPELIRLYEALLSADERDRYDRFVFPADRHVHLVARALVRTTLSRYAEVEPRAWVFRQGTHGRPEIAGPAGAPPLRFSLSHTAGLVALALARGLDVGLDVEQEHGRECDLDIARQYFASSEANALESLPAERQPRAFLEYWTLKEAYIKATGLGLSLPLQSFSFRLGDPPQIAFAAVDGGDPTKWHFARLDLGPRHVAAVAVRHSSRPSLTVRETVPLTPDVRSVRL